MDAGRPYAVARDGAQWIVCDRPSRVLTANGTDTFAALDEMAQGGFWVGFVTYEAGRSIEHVEPGKGADEAQRSGARGSHADRADEAQRSGARGSHADRLPDLAFVRFDDVRRVDELPPWELATSPAPGRGAPTTSLTESEHAALVAQVHALLAAGECYQVNLTRRLTFATAPDPLALFTALARLNPAPYAGVCTFGDALPGVAVVSASPELFLRVDGRAVETRPIKGTAPDGATLEASAKDHAENLMIVDLARNDLGRVCEYGSIEVPSLFALEEHPGLTHLVSTVRGRLRAEVGLGDLVHATFPPASVTGAPKPRVMQAIADLEPVSRGVYCGAFGWIDGDRDRAALAVAIRTFQIAGGHTHLGVGGGIVADSCATAEWAETELKGARLLQAAGCLLSETRAKAGAR